MAFLLLLRLAITDMGFGLHRYTLILLYAYVRRLFFYLLHELMDQRGGRGSPGHDLCR
jgi:hypothetical protein